MSRQRSGKRQFGHAFRQRHHGGHHHGGSASHEDVHAQRLAALERRGVMHTNAAMQLVVQADLLIRHILAARELHAIHAQIGVRQARVIGRPRYTPGAR